MNYIKIKYNEKGKIKTLTIYYPYLINEKVMKDIKERLINELDIYEHSIVNIQNINLYKIGY